MSGCRAKEAPAAAAAAGGQKIKVSVDPVTRIEGHLKADVEVKDGVIVDAHVHGGMYRGFEQILKDRDPRDASQITQRICGVCPTAHATASVNALDDAFNVKLTTNGRLARNMILGANYLQSHILHFYHLAALDYVNGPEMAPFIPRYKNNDIRVDKKTNQIGVDQYLRALEIRRICHEMVAILGGKMPHVAGMVVGGTTQIPSADQIVAYKWRFKKVMQFIEEEYLPLIYTLGKAYPDLLETGGGYKNCISYGVFPLNDAQDKFLLNPGVFTDGKDHPLDTDKIREYVQHSWFKDADTNKHPSQGETHPQPEKDGAYSFIKAPRYNGKPHEAGPLARMWVTNPELSAVAQDAGFKRMRDFGSKAFSILGRHIARAEESYYVANAINQWLDEVQPGAETYSKSEVPEKGEGLGLTEAPRGSLLHYIDVKDYVINKYQIVAATIWNASPRDDMGQLGPIEESLVGTPVPDPKAPVNVGRVIRSFDP